MSLIFLTGSSGFVGSALSNYFGIEKVRKWERGTDLNLDLVSFVFHIAGKSHDLKSAPSFNEYYQSNTILTKAVFDAFLASESRVFITLSSVKAVAHEVEGVLTEEYIPNPITHYGRSKMLAEEYILAQDIPVNKKVYILRPCMIHGQGNKGNLKLLHKLVSIGLPWPLGAFKNERSFCSIDNLMFIFKELVERDDIPSGIYNVADDDPLSTNEVITILAKSQGRSPRIWSISKSLIEFLAKIGNFLKLPLNEERLQKLTNSYVVSNKKLMGAIGKPLPVSSRDGLLRTFQSFQ